MQQNFNEVTCVFPRKFEENLLLAQKASMPFDNMAVQFLDALSKQLNTDINIRQYPDVATFAFFCRKANIFNLKKLYDTNEGLRLGRGIVFHVAPSNVPVNFAYSLISGILSGNINIVRVPSKEFEQVQMICRAIEKVAENDQFMEMGNRMLLVKYPRESQATKYFSSICDVRVIWGGDQTIADIRRNQLPARSFDVTFADRYSFCVINADELVHGINLERLAQGFYNDTYLFDQNACTAPHLVVWLGENKNVEKARQMFWDSLSDLVEKKYNFQAVMAVDKLTAFYSQAIKSDRKIKAEGNSNNLWRVQIDTLPVTIDEFRCTGGYFSEYHAQSLDEIAPIINRKYQTLAYYGLTKKAIETFIKTATPVGLDRIVPIGQTSEFSLIWDGYNLITTFSRDIDI
ncbi:MAG TPA: acyl-CoA reductase [Marinilabiliales bacterium]|nr:MAG: acyl-CoA reductase [Bacteroidetes bacterium GWD2_40_43]OFX89685.1 MAG: acyl-CoA reductase [Bacteroidetes bacterium GWE2_40_63]OFY24201.1 MAG: acyl-CoA reductase [Bacteroidetes bacterium GWF2_40_13]OFZ26395.1 MAG: acyl-CoA reductase [Bacteroidetes bacterium RIFOXYC2_FULL_40_12]HAM99589.1 acyl-CoA reductase [Marinilabiliales bacterium]